MKSGKYWQRVSGKLARKGIESCSYHLKVSFLGILVGQDTIVGELPAKRIRDDDHDAFGRAAWRIRDVAVEAVDLLNASLWRTGMERTGGTALLENHVGWCVLRDTGVQAGRRCTG